MPTTFFFFFFFVVVVSLFLVAQREKKYSSFYILFRFQGPPFDRINSSVPQMFSSSKMFVGLARKAVLPLQSTKMFMQSFVASGGMMVGSSSFQDQIAVKQIKYQYKRNCYSSAGSNLHEVLANEVAAEAANDEVDQEYLDAKKSILSKFKLHEEDGNGVVKLEQKYKGETIEVTFDCQDEEELDMSEEQMEQAAAVEGDEDGAVADLDVGVNFDVVITKKEGKMVVSCTASQSLAINQVRFVPNGKALEDTEMYGGPIFDQLDNELQDAFYAYLAERSVDEDLSFFILAHSGLKEQKEYVHWLNKMLDFTK